MLQRARAILKEHFGYSSFKKGQEQIIESILQGRDTLGIMPTGGGKSVCYQLPALLFQGLTLVISPLISLMKDQVDALDSLGIPGTFINSSLSFAEVEGRINQAARGQYKLLYVAPESWNQPGLLTVSALPVPCWQWMKLTVSPSGAMTSGPVTAPSRRLLKNAAPRWWRPLQRRPLLRCADIINMLGLMNPKVL